MSDSEAVVEKRRGRPSKDKSEVIISIFKYRWYIYDKDIS